MTSEPKAHLTLSAFENRLLCAVLESVLEDGLPGVVPDEKETKALKRIMEAITRRRLEETGSQSATSTPASGGQAPNPRHPKQPKTRRWTNPNHPRVDGMTTMDWVVYGLAQITWVASVLFLGWIMTAHPFTAAASYFAGSTLGSWWWLTTPREAPQ